MRQSSGGPSRLSRASAERHAPRAAQRHVRTPPEDRASCQESRAARSRLTVASRDPRASTRIARGRMCRRASTEATRRRASDGPTSRLLTACSGRSGARARSASRSASVALSMSTMTSWNRTPCRAARSARSSMNVVRTRCVLGDGDVLRSRVLSSLGSSRWRASSVAAAQRHGGRHERDHGVCGDHDQACVRGEVGTWHVGRPGGEQR